MAIGKFLYRKSDNMFIGSGFSDAPDPDEIIAWLT